MRGAQTVEEPLVKAVRRQNGDQKEISKIKDGLCTIRQALKTENDIVSDHRPGENTGLQKIKFVKNVEKPLRSGITLSTQLMELYLYVRFVTLTVKKSWPLFKRAAYIIRVSKIPVTTGT